MYSFLTWAWNPLVRYILFLRKKISTSERGMQGKSPSSVSGRGDDAVGQDVTCG
jgi:hypothetical protein